MLTHATLPQQKCHAVSKIQKLAPMALAVWMAINQTPTLAATLNVNTTNPNAVADGKCSLIEAIRNANDNVDGTANGNGQTDCPAGAPKAADVINLPANGLITLSSINNTTGGANGLPVISSLLTIQGFNSRITRNSAAPAFRIFRINNTGILTLNKTTVSGGSATSVGGGGIYNEGKLTLANSTITGNNASPANSGINLFFGGGLMNRGVVNITNTTVEDNTAKSGGGGISNSGTMTIDRSTLISNTASGGGGIFHNGATLTIKQSTITQNRVEFGGGGIQLLKVSPTAPTLSLINSTVVKNTISGSTSKGGGIYNNGGSLSIKNSLIVGNNAVTGKEISNNSPILPRVDDYNLFGHSKETNAQAFVGFTPGLELDITATKDGTLPTDSGSIISLFPAINGGLTKTHALDAKSPAVNAIPNSNCEPGLDQRVLSRPQGTDCDIGSVEATAAARMVIDIEDTPDPVQINQPLSYTVTASNGGLATSTGIKLSFQLPKTVTFISATQTCTQSNQVVNCTFRNITGGRLTQVVIRVKPTVIGTISATAELTTTEQPTPDVNTTKKVEITRVIP